MRTALAHALLAVLVAATAGEVRADFVRLISSGDPLPGGGEVLDFSLPVLNEAGDVLVQARFDLEPDGAYDGRVIVLIPAGGTPVEIARSGDPAGGGSTIANFFTQASAIHFLSDNGRAAFLVTRSDGMGKAIMSGIGGSPIVHFAEGDLAPASTLGETISNLYLIGYTDDGDILYLFQPYRPGFTGTLEFWSNSARVAWHGQTWGTTTLSDFGLIATSESGDMVLDARDASLSSPNDRIWVRPFEGGFVQILDEVQPAPDGGNFQLDVYGGMRMYSLPLSLVFGADRSGVPVSESSGIYFGGGGSASKIMGLGGSAPAGGTWYSMDTWDFDSSSNMLIHAQERRDGETNRYQYLLRSGPGGILNSIAVEGDADPSGAGTLISFSEAAMSVTGSVAALGAVRIGAVNKDALWVFDGGTATTLAQEGESFDGQVLTNVGFAGRVAGTINRRAMNESGDVVFLAEGAVRKAIYLSESGSSVDAPPSRVARVAIESVRPNPFNPRTTIAWSADGTDRVELAIYDLAGRCVRTLFSGDVDPGMHETEWSGVDDSGRRVASGTYICRLSSAGAVHSSKLSLIQ